MSTARAFTLRLALAIGVTFALIGVAGYGVLAGQVQRRLLDGYRAEQRADARSLEAASARDDDRAHAEVTEISTRSSPGRARARPRS